MTKNNTQIENAGFECSVCGAAWADNDDYPDYDERCTAERCSDLERNAAVNIGIVEFEKKPLHFLHDGCGPDDDSHAKYMSFYFPRK